MPRSPRVQKTGRPALSALSCVVLAGILLAGFFVGFGYLLIGRGIELERNLVGLLQPGGALRSFLEHVNAHLPQLARQSLQPAAIA